jgi:hypothetical protein
LTDSPLPSSIDNPPFSTVEPDALFPGSEAPDPKKERRRLEAQQDEWFRQWWDSYWLKKSRKRAREAFGRQVRTEAQFQRIMSATQSQSDEMLGREPRFRPQGASWINAERWNDETAPAVSAKPDAINRAMLINEWPQYVLWKPPQ